MSATFLHMYPNNCFAGEKRVGLFLDPSSACDSPEGKTPCQAGKSAAKAGVAEAVSAPHPQPTPEYKHWPCKGVCVCVCEQHRSLHFTQRSRLQEVEGEGEEWISGCSRGAA